ncbi:serine/arginine-rich splicing factor 3-like [Porites lutea]
MSEKVYVGGLGNSGDKQELWRAFSKYGTLRDVWVARSPPGFAFVHYEDFRDAEEAVRAMDGRRLGDKKLRVELSRTRNREEGRGGRRGGRGSGYRGSSSRYDRRDDNRRNDYSRGDYGSQRFSQSHQRSPPPRSQDYSQGRYSRRRSRSRSPVKHSD